MEDHLLVGGGEGAEVGRGGDDGVNLLGRCGSGGDLGGEVGGRIDTGLRECKQICVSIVLAVVPLVAGLGDRGDLRLVRLGREGDETCGVERAVKEVWRFGLPIGLSEVVGILQKRAWRLSLGDRDRPFASSFL